MVADRGDKASGSTDDAVLALYRRQAGLIYRLALSITRDVGLAEDVVQEAFCRLQPRLATLEPKNLDGYLYRTARNLALDLASKGAPVGLEPALLEAPPERALDPDLVAKLGAALWELPLEQREVVLLRVVEGCTFPQLAALLDVPEGTTHSRFRYAMQRLRQALKGLDA